MRLLLVHGQASERQECVAHLHAWGHEVLPSGLSIQEQRHAAPDAVVFRLRDHPDRLRSRANDFRAEDGLRSLPLVFVDTPSDLVHDLMAEFEDVHFTHWDDLEAVLASLAPSDDTLARSPAVS